MYRGNKQTYRPLYGEERVCKKTAQTHSVFLVFIVLLAAFFVFNIVGFSAKLLIAVVAMVVFSVAFINTETRSMPKPC